jgi:hypothetical protein
MGRLLLKIERSGMEGLKIPLQLKSQIRTTLRMRRLAKEGYTDACHYKNAVMRLKRMITQYLGLWFRGRSWVKRNSILLRKKEATSNLYDEMYYYENEDIPIKVVKPKEKLKFQKRTRANLKLVKAS